MRRLKTSPCLRRLQIVISFHDGHDFLKGLVLVSIKALESSTMTFPFVFRYAVRE